MKRDREISQFVVTPCETSLQLLVALPPFRYLKKLETGQKQDEPPPKKSNQWTLSEQHASSPKSGLSFSLPPLEMHVSFTMLIHAQWLRADSVTAAVSLNISLSLVKIFFFPCPLYLCRSFPLVRFLGLLSFYYSL